MVHYPRTPENWLATRTGSNKPHFGSLSLYGRLYGLSQTKVALYCFSFELPLVIVFRNPRGKRETPTWQSHVPAGIFLRQLYRVSAFLLKTTSSLRNDNRGLFYPPVNLSNLTVSSRLGRPSPQMVSYHFLRQTRGHPDTTTAVRSTLACD